MIATHYHVKKAAGIRFYQVRGISPDALEELSTYRYAPPKTNEKDDISPVSLTNISFNMQPEDLTRVRRIQNLMDYRIEEIDGVHQSASGAIKIAELLAVDEELLREMKAARQEE